MTLTYADHRALELVVRLRSRGRCEWFGRAPCGRPFTELHHLHYLTFSQESPKDLLGLCRQHHRIYTFRGSTFLGPAQEGAGRWAISTLARPTSTPTQRTAALEIIAAVRSMARSNAFLVAQGHPPLLIGLGGGARPPGPLSLQARIRSLLLEEALPCR